MLLFVLRLRKKFMAQLTHHNFLNVNGLIVSTETDMLRGHIISSFLITLRTIRVFQSRWKKGASTVEPC